MNFIFIAGRLGSDPETRFTPSGKKVTNFRVATSTKKKGVEKTTWWRIAVWGEEFDQMISYLKKGSAVMIQGDLQEPQIYNDREGKPQCSLEINATKISFSPFGSGKSEGNSSNGNAGRSQGSAGGFDNGGFDTGGFNFEPVMSGSQHAALEDDEIPF